MSYTFKLLTLRPIYVDGDTGLKIVCVEQDCMEHHRELTVGDERFRVTIDRQIVSRKFAHLSATIRRNAYRRIERLMHCFSRERRIPRTIYHRVIVPRVMSIEMEEISRMTENLTIDDPEELQEMIGPSVTPASSDDEEEMEIHLREEDLIDQGVSFDPDWPPGEDID